MPTLVSKKYKSKTRWYIAENQTEDGKQKRVYLENLGYITKTEAKHKLSNYVVFNNNKGSNKITFTKATIEFKKFYKQQIGQSISSKTYDLFEYSADKLNTYLGNIELRNLEFDNIESLKLELLNTHKLSNRVVNMHLTDLKKVLEYSIDRKWLHALPKIKRLSEVKSDKQIDALSREEIETLLKYANEKQSIYLHLMIFSGMRPNEAIKLTWDNVDLEKEYIDVESDNRLKQGRRIPLHSKLKELLLEIRQGYGKVSPFSDSTYARKSLKRLETLVSNQTGKIISCNPYKLRKTFGSILAQSGADTIFVAKLMGHRKLQTTYQYYLRLNNDNLKTAIEKL